MTVNIIHLHVTKKVPIIRLNQPTWKKFAADNGMQYKLWSDENLDEFVKLSTRIFTILVGGRCTPRRRKDLK